MTISVHSFFPRYQRSKENQNRDCFKGNLSDFRILGKIFKLYEASMKQESIPVGCVPPASAVQRILGNGHMGTSIYGQTDIAFILPSHNFVIGR